MYLVTVLLHIIIGNKIDTTLIAQEPYLGTNYIEVNVEEDIHLKKQ